MCENIYHQWHAFGNGCSDQFKLPLAFQLIHCNNSDLCTDSAVTCDCLPSWYLTFIMGQSQSFHEWSFLPVCTYLICACSVVQLVNVMVIWLILIYTVLEQKCQTATLMFLSMFGLCELNCCQQLHNPISLYFFFFFFSVCISTYLKTTLGGGKW